ncbi:MAG: hypothetical protein HRU25_16955 [Psychrobium sp.]|nr:hypothetical protein [Psychrobium sp.]
MNNIKREEAVRFLKNKFEPAVIGHTALTVDELLFVTSRLNSIHDFKISVGVRTPSEMLDILYLSNVEIPKSFIDAGRQIAVNVITHARKAVDKEIAANLNRQAQADARGNDLAKRKAFITEQGKRLLEENEQERRGLGGKISQALTLINVGEETTVGYAGRTHKITRQYPDDSMLATEVKRVVREIDTTAFITLGEVLRIYRINPMKMGTTNMINASSWNRDGALVWDRRSLDTISRVRRR